MNKKINRRLVYISLLCSVLAFSGCGSASNLEFGKVPLENAGTEYRANLGKGFNGADSEGFLPKQLVDINNGGTIPEGEEIKKQCEEADISMYSLLGNWELKNPTDAVKEMKAPYLYTADGTSVAGEVNVFPKYISFAEWFYTEVAKGLPIENDDLSVLFTESLRDEYLINNRLYDTDTTNSTKLGKALFNQGIEGMGQRETTFTIPNVYFTDGYRITAYKLSGDTLAVGILDAGTNGISLSGNDGDIGGDIDETWIAEFDYKVEFIGRELRLTYNGETATYIPSMDDAEDDGLADKLYESGAMFAEDTVDGILSIGFKEDGMSIMRNNRDGVEKIEYKNEENGKLSFEGKDYTYRRSKDVFTLMSSDGQVGYYGVGVKRRASPCSNLTVSFKIGGQNFTLERKTSLESLLQMNVKTSADLNRIMSSHEISEELPFEFAGVKFGVIVTNIKSHEETLRNCYISGIRMTEDSDSFLFAPTKINRIGDTTMDEVYFYYDEPYEMKPNEIFYKGGGLAKIEMISMGRFADDYDGPELKAENKFDVIYKFDDKGVISEIDINQPSLLYLGLDDNIEYEQVANLEPYEIVAVAEKRDNILAQIKEAFEDAGVSAEIDEGTGEIRMNSSILFAIDSSTLSSEGKSYIDDFMKAYASVVLSSENSGAVSSIEFEGHTDKSGGYDYNMALSQKRAEAVMEYCTNETGLSDEEKSKMASISNATGYGYTNPVYSDNGSVDSTASRRVSIKFFVKAK